MNKIQLKNEPAIDTVCSPVKTLLFSFTLAGAFILLFSACSPGEIRKNKIEGVWRLISFQPPQPDGRFEGTEGDWQMIKIYTHSHFMFSEQSPGRPAFENGGDEAELCEAAKGFFGGAGTYHMDSDTSYTEHVQIFLNPTYIDAEVTYTCTFVSENTWIQEGYLPAKALGLANEDYHIYEVYERIE